MKERKKLFIFLFVIFFIANISQAQSIFTKNDSSAKQTSFLWFTGHWKSKNVFVTQSATDSTEGGMVYSVGGGSTITVTPGGRVNMSSNQVDEWNKKIDAGLKNLQQFQDELEAPSEQINEWTHHFTEVLKPQLDNLKTEYTSYKIDKKNDLTNPGGKQEGKTPLQNFASGLNQWCNEVRPKYDAVISFYEAHKKDKESDYNNPAPPDFDYSCVSCDTSLQNKHDKQTDDYIEKFFKPESDLLNDALSIERQLMYFGIGEDFTGSSANVAMEDGMQEAVNNAFNKKKNGACSYIDDYKLNKAIQFLPLRMYSRAEKLFKDYRNNVKTFHTVINIFLLAARGVELMGLKQGGADVLEECLSLAEKAFGYYSDKLFIEHDWSQLANIPFLFSLESGLRLLGAPKSGFSEKIQNLLNSFHLEIEMNVKLGKDIGYVIAHLKGDEKIAPEFKYHENGNDTCYSWVVVEGTDPKGYPKKKITQTIDCDVLTNEIITPAGPRPVYIGTKKYYSILHGLEMDYCHPGQDTIFLSGFIPQSNGNGGNWQMPGGVQAPLQINGTDNVFRDVNKMKGLATSGKAKQGAEQMKAEGEKIIAQMKSIQAQMGNGRNASNLASMQKIQDIVNKAHGLGTTENVAPMLYIDFPLQIQNNNKVLVAHEGNNRFDAKKINPGEANTIVYGYFTVKVEYKNQTQ